MSQLDPHRPTGTPGVTPPGSPRKDEGPSLSSFAGAGLQFGLAILLFLFVGRWLDAKLGTAPWLLIVGVFVGAGAGFYSMYLKLTAPRLVVLALRR